VIHLDTSFLIRGLAAGSAESRLLRNWLHEATPIGMSAIGWSEFLCGPVEPDQIELVKALVEEFAPFFPQDAELAARFFNLSGRRRGSLIDCMIAATAVRLRAHLATSNRADFRKLEVFGLRLTASLTERASRAEG
jgi:predicted nucleic acid-binding protein